MSVGVHCVRLINIFAYGVIYTHRILDVPEMIKYRQIILIEGGVLRRYDCLWDSIVPRFRFRPTDLIYP